mmetsp:Transcript_6507/g.10901  ORF Transcript_6507/g.10901 Transcript_6507/m.10901 type:complete len:613 (+) Transcript_6507:694-2532(+)
MEDVLGGNLEAPSTGEASVVNRGKIILCQVNPEPDNAIMLPAGAKIVLGLPPRPDPLEVAVALAEDAYTIAYDRFLGGHLAVYTVSADTQLDGLMHLAHPLSFGHGGFQWPDDITMPCLGRKVLLAGPALVNHYVDCMRQRGVSVPTGQNSTSGTSHATIPGTNRPASAPDEGIQYTSSSTSGGFRSIEDPITGRPMFYTAQQHAYNKSARVQTYLQCTTFEERKTRFSENQPGTLIDQYVWVNIDTAARNQQQHSRGSSEMNGNLYGVGLTNSMSTGGVYGQVWHELNYEPITWKLFLAEFGLYGQYTVESARLIHFCDHSQARSVDYKVVSRATLAASLTGMGMFYNYFWGALWDRPFNAVVTQLSANWDRHFAHVDKKYFWVFECLTMDALHRVFSTIGRERYARDDSAVRELKNRVEQALLEAFNGFGVNSYQMLAMKSGQEGSPATTIQNRSTRLQQRSLQPKLCKLTEVVRGSKLGATSDSDESEEAEKPKKKKRKTKAKDAKGLRQVPPPSTSPAPTATEAAKPICAKYVLHAYDTKFAKCTDPACKREHKIPPGYSGNRAYSLIKGLARQVKGYHLTEDEVRALRQWMQRPDSGFHWTPDTHAS